MKPSELLREGRNQLFERGHTKGELERDGQVCSIGALYCAVYGTARPSGQALADMETHSQFLSAYRCLKRAANCDFVADWNDRPNRTFSEVIDAFDKAEKLAEAAEAEVDA